MDYKSMIIDMIQKIEDDDFLEFVYRFAKRLKENWGI